MIKCNGIIANNEKISFIAAMLSGLFTINKLPEEEMSMKKNYYSATATAAKITGIDPGLSERTTEKELILKAAF